MSPRAVLTNESAGSHGRVNYLFVVFGNLLTLPAASAVAVLDHDLAIFCGYACVIALLSLQCALGLKRRVGVLGAEKREENKEEQSCHVGTQKSRGQKRGHH